VEAKKLAVMIVILTALITITFAYEVYANETVNVTINGQYKEFEVPAQLVNGRTMLPLRGIAEALNLIVNYNPETRMATLTQNDTVIIHEVGTADIIVNGIISTFDTPSLIVQGRTLVPVRMLAEATNAEVEWQQRTRTAAIIIEHPLSSQMRTELESFLANYRSLFGESINDWPNFRHGGAVSINVAADGFPPPFYDATTGLKITDITGRPYLLMDNDHGCGETTMIAVDYTLFAWDNDGIPGVVINYRHLYLNGVVRHRFYRYGNGAFNFVYEVEMYGGLGAFRTDNHGRLLVHSFDTWARAWTEVSHILVGNAGVERELVASWQPDLQWENGSGHYGWLEAADQWEAQGFNLYNYPIPGRVDVRIPTVTPWSLLQESITTTLTERLRYAGLIL